MGKVVDHADQWTTTGIPAAWSTSGPLLVHIGVGEEMQ
jgi:hypothetical protein